MTISRFGHGKISCRGKKIQLIRFFALILCFTCILCSCLGRTYEFNLSSDELETDLISVDVICIQKESNPLSFETICSVDENDVPHIIETISSLVFKGTKEPQSGFYKYAFKFNYPQNYVVISRGRIYYLDENFNQYNGHELYAYPAGIVDLLSNYIPLEDMDGFVDHMYNDGSHATRPAE